MSTTRARSGPRTLLAIAAALGLLAALTLPAFGGEETDWAEVTGYAPGTAENNEASTWGANCEKLPTPEGGWGPTFELPALAEGMVYSLVIVKAGSDQSTDDGPNTLFEDPAAGETVWADSVADGVFGEGDKNISHIIICTEEEDEEEEEETPTPTPTPTASPTPTPTPTPTERDGELGGNPTPTPAGGTVPDTAMGGMDQVPATVLSLIMLAALAGTAYARLARQR